MQNKQDFIEEFSRNASTFFDHLDGAKQRWFVAATCMLAMPNVHRYVPEIAGKTRDTSCLIPSFRDQARKCHQ